MKKTLKPILSLLLAFAMLLPMAGIARADGEIIVTPSTAELFCSADHTHTTTLSATLTNAAAADATITWASNDEKVTVSPASTVSSGTVTLSAFGTVAENAPVTITATHIPAGSSAVSKNATITLKADPISVVRSSAELSLRVHETKDSGLTAAYACGQSAALSYSGYNANIVTVAADGKVTGVSVGTTTITATSTADSTKFNTVTVTVTEDQLLTTNPVTLSPASASIKIGETAELTATATFQSGYQITNAESFTITSGDSSIASCDKSTGKIIVTGKSAGSTTITAYYTFGGNNYSAVTTITVGTPTTTVSDTASVNEKKSMSKVFNDLYYAFRTRYNDYPSNATIAFDFAANSIGTLVDNNGNEVISNYAYSFDTLSGFYLDVTKEGSYQCNVTITEPSTARQLSATVTITVAVNTVNIRIPVGGTSYEFVSSAFNTSNSGYQLIENALSGTGYKSIVFGTPRGTENGTLYTSYDQRTAVGNTTTLNKTSLESLYFVPSKSTGSYIIPYVAYAKEANTQNNSQVAKGELTIVINPASLNVSVTLDKVEAYTFSQAPNSAVTTSASAANTLINAIDGALGNSAWSYVCFDVPNSSAIGTLYPSSGAASALKSTAQISRYSLSSLYFVPTEIGTYEISFSVYDGNNTPIATGTLTIDVASILGDASFQYSVGFGKSVSLSENEFADFVYDKLGGNYALSYITFNTYNGKGTFYDGSKKFTPGGSTQFYADSYDGKLPSSPHYLSDVSFTAPDSNAGFTAVSFTATASNGTRTRTASGVFYIFYSGEVPVITYDVRNSTGVALSESDFVSVYKSAMNSSASNPQFRIRLQSIPGSGYLYQSSSSRNSTQLTSRTVANTYYTVGGNSSTRSISTVTYSPLVFGTGAIDKITYIAYSTSDTPLFTGEIMFKSITPRTENIASDGLDFSFNDFYSAGDSDPVTYVTFKTPASGKIYVTDNGRLIPITEATKLFTLTPTDGDYAVSSTHYVPRAANTTPVTLTYVAHLKSGAYYENTIVVTPSSKTSSATFYDVAGNVGSWSANSVDFATKFGLVKGVGNGQFNPNGPMNRCDLVLILYRMAGSPAVSGMAPFSEFPITATYSDSYKQEIYNSALWAYNNHVLDGVTDGVNYRPFEATTRQDYATILYNYNKNVVKASVSNSGSIERFADKDQVASYALAAMQWAVGNNYMLGTSTDPNRPMLSPTSTTTRAEIVTLLHRYLTY